MFDPIFTTFTMLCSLCFGERTVQCSPEHDLRVFACVSLDDHLFLDRYEGAVRGGSFDRKKAANPSSDAACEDDTEDR